MRVAVGATHGTIGEIDIDPKGVEQYMTTGFVRPLWGRNLFSAPIRGLHPRLFTFIPAGDGNAAQMLNSTAVHPGPLPIRWGEGGGSAAVGKNGDGGWVASLMRDFCSEGKYPGA